jgi:large subunit ribosomal protein L19
MVASVIEKINKEGESKTEIPPFRVGDLVEVHVRIREGDKERIQLYKGTVIARDGGGSTETFTVRRLSYGVGVERVFPVHSPFLSKIVVERSSHVRRAKLYFLRHRIGKKSRLRSKNRS